MTYIHNNQALLPDPDLVNLVNEITSAESMEAACRSLASFYDNLDGELLLIKFYDCEDHTRVVRPFIAYPDAVLTITADLMNRGGCPFSKEANRLMCPFDSYSVDQSRYASFMEKRFFKEMANTGHKHIAILPVMIGKGVAMANVGLFGQPFSGPLRDKICSSIPHIITAFVSRFPEANTFFEEKALTTSERNLLRMMCEGFSQSEIALKLRLSEHTIKLMLDKTMQKLNARNLSQLIYKSMVLGEIWVGKSEQ